MDENGRSQISRAPYAYNLGTPESGVSDPRGHSIVSRRVCCYMIWLPSESINPTQGVYRSFGLKAEFDNEDVSFQQPKSSS